MIISMVNPTGKWTAAWQCRQYGPWSLDHPTPMPDDAVLTVTCCLDIMIMNQRPHGVPMRWCWRLVLDIGWSVTVFVMTAGPRANKLGWIHRSSIIGRTGGHPLCYCQREPNGIYYNWIQLIKQFHWRRPPHLKNAITLSINAADWTWVQWSGVLVTTGENTRLYSWNEPEPFKMANLKSFTSTLHL